MGGFKVSNLLISVLSTMSITAALPLIHQSDKLHEFDCNTVMEALIFNNKENLSSLNCGKVETNNTTRTKHFSWDAQVEIGNKTCAGIFISPKAVLTSATCFDSDSSQQIFVKTENASLKIETKTELVNLYGGHSIFSFAIVNLVKSVNVTPICLWNFGPKKASYGQHLHYKVTSLKKNKLKVLVDIENPAMCYAYASKMSNEKLKQEKFLCTALEKSMRTKAFSKIQDGGFLIKRTQQQWFLRGIPLRETVVYGKNANAFNDIFTHLRWIVENSERLYALPAVAPPAKPYIFNDEEDNLSSPTCGLTSDKAGTSAFQVYSGKTSMEGAHPWHAFVEVTVNDNFSRSCGGTLIKENVVLTAAHCVKFENNAIQPNQIDVTLGVHSLYGNSTRENHHHQKMKPTKLIVHPEYVGNKNDIALLIFESNFKRTHRVSTLCLWNRGGDLDSIVNTMGSVVGFGSTGNLGNETILPSELQQADLPVLSYEKCFQTGNSSTFSRNLIPGENFCAGYKNGTTTCRGDSGGSFAIRVDGRWFLRGITSFGAMKSKSENHCDDNYSVFLDVTKYIPWIMKNVESVEQLLKNTGFFTCVSNSILSFFGIKKK